MKQAHLIGRIDGLRPSQRKRLEFLTHFRFSEEEDAKQFIIERLSEEVLALDQSIHLILDERGLCRLLCVGDIHTSRALLEQHQVIFNRKITTRRIISCLVNLPGQEHILGNREAMSALDLNVIYWLRFCSHLNSEGKRSACLFQPNRLEKNGWELCISSDLITLINQLVLYKFEKKRESYALNNSSERVLILVLTNSCKERNIRDLAELNGLVKSAGANTVAIVSQRQSSLNLQTIWGKGKLEEVALEVRRNSASLVITDRELTPVQARNLEKIVDCRVIDRSELIIDIFAKRASSASGRLQVELAQLRYLMPRLTGRGKHLSRQGGGIGTRGPGEKKIEKDKRRILKRIEGLNKHLNQLNKHREIIRKKRLDLPSVALVGYTNVGKSTLLNALCDLSEDRQVITQDKLFATLDTTTRRLIIPRIGKKSQELLLTDTVGFIRELPATLIEAFRATLEETLQADLLLLLVDLSNHDWKDQLKEVNKLLDSFGANPNRQVVANQIDQCENEAIESISEICSTVLFVSAVSGAGLQGLKKWLQNYFWSKESESKQVNQVELKHG